MVKSFNKRKLKSIRIEKGITPQAIADEIGIPLEHYYSKENGRIRFTECEKAALVRTLDLTFPEFNIIFFDGMLSFGTVN